MAHKPMRVPVLPSPALQWMAMAPGSEPEKCLSHISIKSSTILSGGVDPSMKNKSL